MTEKKNSYDYVSGSIIATEVEKTQINKFHTKGGTGFAAEDANLLNDKLRGHKVDQVGTTNELNGADRIVNRVPIQTKYYDSPNSTIKAAFNNDTAGNYRYNGQLLEVPSDQYDDCVRLMRKKIEEGKVPGITDPKEAEEIVKKGDVTYKQAKNIAKAGNIDSLVFDMKSQSIVSTYAFAISFSISFAKMKWDGKSTEDALKESVSMALQSGATSFITGIATAQILRTKTAAIGVVFMRDSVKSVAQTNIGKSVVEKVAQASLGKAVYGAAATNHVAKLLRTNVVTSVATTVIISAPDFYRAAFSGSISWAQFAKNLTVNGAGVAGGAGGWMAGAAGGAVLGSAIPIIGTAAGGIIGGILGAFAGGTAAASASKYLLDGLIEDDAKEMIKLLPEYLQPLATDYMLSETETKELSRILKEKVDASFLRDMYQSSSRRSFVYNSFESSCEEIIKKRKKVILPNASQVQLFLTEIEEKILNEEELAY
jgi:gas vesicle protein